MNVRFSQVKSIHRDFGPNGAGTSWRTFLVKKGVPNGPKNMVPVLSYWTLKIFQVKPLAI
jgi:hypothetical protein